MGQFTFQIDDQLKLLSSNTYTDIERCALFAINNISRYVNWKGSVDFIVRIRPGTELTWSSADGLLPSLGQIGWNGKDWVNETLIEMQTGFDSDPKKPDAGCTIYLAKDGTIRNYGAPVWFDPSPSFDVNPDIPKSTHDFIGIFTHEVFHCFGLYGATSQWKSLVEKRGKNYFFTGSKTTSLLGGHLMLADAYSENNFPDHYGNTASIENNIARGLMFQWGNYERNRLDIGRVDLAILEDLGVEVLTYKGLPVTELSDVSPNVTGTPRSEAIHGDYHSNYLSGGEGHDTLDGAYGNDTIDGGSGDDQLEGGAGIDTALYASTRESYTLKSNSNGSWTVTFTGPIIATLLQPLNEGTDTLISVEKVHFADTVVNLEDISPLAPTVQFTTTAGSTLEGNTGSTTVTVQALLSVASTQEVAIPITYSGTATSGTDYSNATTSITIAAGQTTGAATFSILGDTNVEPNETINLTMGTPTNATLGTNKVYTHTVLNDDLDQQIVSRTNALTVLVEEGVLESKPVLLKDLVEVITTTGSTVTSHTVTYQGTKFKYSDIDALITTVIRNGEFTVEFRKEIADQYPTVGNITYKEAVSLVGAANIDSILIGVAGADGNYVG